MAESLEKRLAMAENAWVAARNHLDGVRAEKSRLSDSRYIGRYFRYRNCCSCPSEPSDYWPLFIHVTGMDDRGALTGVTVQRDKYNRIDIESGHVATNTVVSADEITAGEFNRQADALLVDARNRLLGES